MTSLEEWDLCDKVKAMCFDTTSSNTGCKNGSCILLEQRLQHKLLYLACRHHVLEIIIGAAFEKSVGGSSGPDVLLFKRLKEQWSFMNQGQLKPGPSSEYVQSILTPIRDNILEFAHFQLQEMQCRDDYREFLELSIIFLGDIPARGVRLIVPGEMHHARWMSKILYAIKIWMFRGQFKLPTGEETGLRDIAVFSVHDHLNAWMMAPLATSALQ